uniref:Late endosomal/lysosomal adaptor and MAPK and MTOR activator 4 n=1 Tax=Strongyloides venezuelensis TaxID=75913 RepID=A0A0K0FVW6_STRVS
MVNEVNVLSKIPGATGYMIINDGELVRSGGDLEGNLYKADIIMKLLSTCSGHHLTAINEKWNCLTIEFENALYGITVSSSMKNTVVIKKNH